MAPRSTFLGISAALMVTVLAFAPGSQTISPAHASSQSRSSEAAAVAGGVEVYDIVVSKAGSGKGRITSDPPYLNCGDMCETSLESGAALTLTADPDPGSRFSKWSGACAGQGAICQITLTADMAATATFTAVVVATAKPSPEPTAEPTETPVVTSSPAPTVEPPTIAPTVPGAATPEPTLDPGPSNTGGGIRPIVVLLAILLVGLLTGLGVVIVRGRRKEMG